MSYLNYCKCKLGFSIILPMKTRQLEIQNLDSWLEHEISSDPNITDLELSDKFQIPIHVVRMTRKRVGREWLKELYKKTGKLDLYEYYLDLVEDLKQLRYLWTESYHFFESNYIKPTELVRIMQEIRKLEKEKLKIKLAIKM